MWVHGVAVECEETLQAHPDPILSVRGLGQIEPGGRRFAIQVADDGDLNWFSVVVPNPGCLADTSLYLDTLYLMMTLDPFVHLVQAQVWRGNGWVWQQSFQRLPHFVGLAGDMVLPSTQDHFSNVNSLARVVERDSVGDVVYSRPEADLHAGIQVRMALTTYHAPPDTPQLSARFVGVGIDFVDQQETTVERIPRGPFPRP